MTLFLKSSFGVVLGALLVWFFWLDFALFGLSFFYPNLNENIQKIEQDFEKFYSQMLLDSKTMEQISVFNPITYTKDASVFLNPIVSWSNYYGQTINSTTTNDKIDVAENSKANVLQAKKTLKLNAELIDILNAEKDFSKIKIQWAKYKLDFSWLKQLSSYDHWNFTQNLPYKINEVNFDVLGAPTPKYSDLMNWSKLYLLYSRDFKLLDKNTKDIDHLAMLIYSQQSFLNAMVALNILKFKSVFHKTLNKDEQNQIQGVLLIDDQIKAVNRFLIAISGLYSVIVPENIFNSLRLIKVSSCLFLEESVIMNANLKFLFSMSYPNSIMRINQLSRQIASGCPDTYAKRAWISQSYQDRIAKSSPLEMVQGPTNINQTKEHTQPSNINLTFEDLAKSPRRAKPISNLILKVGAVDPFRLYKE